MFDNRPEEINKIATKDHRTEPKFRERDKISTNLKCLRCGGSISLCVWEPNKAVILDAYPIPLIEDILSFLHCCKVSTNLDLSQAYHQIRFHPDCRYLAVFTTHTGIQGLIRLPYGLSSVPCAFQRYLSKLIIDIKGVSCCLDDIIIGGGSTDIDEKLNQALSRHK
ncbi:hypothetical protein LAZ67_7001120 [Cordylochernes scorpioides]|uniref:Reverse transcriptase domain-containing protein n=1 Tax=Cordylochernes scorpioides TaxID=51811 RepID=A0ABY6KM12_9ARAC|nr:hypothetical protein LAZ67_7001120 [Cordylochernes scorpioides]